MKWLLTCGWLLLALISSAQQVVWTGFLDSVTVFSSPRAVDLNGDQVKDIVIGGGKEAVPLSNGVAAFDGATGNLLWTTPARDQVYGSAIFQDINNDQVPDAVLAGRGGLFFAVNGATGATLWEFWPDSLGPPAAAQVWQFYNPQFVPDQDNDGLPDLVVTNGGDPSQGVLDTIRPPGYLMLISGATGALIASDSVPDFKETYHSPLIITDAAGNPDILFGTGGERIRGKYFRVPLADLKAGNIDNAQAIATDSLKGFICPAALADLTGNQHYDIIVPALNGRMIALDGISNAPLWEVRLPGFEFYTSPAVGNFTGDPTPDVFFTAARGLWPFYGSFHEILVDGATGQIIKRDSTGYYHFSTPNVLDWDNDGVDEVLMVRNRDQGTMTVDYYNQFLIRDFNDTVDFTFGASRQGISIFSTPLLTDLDDNQELDWVYAWHPVQGSWNTFDGAYIARMKLGFDREEIPWGSYLGTWFDGTYRGNLPVQVIPATASFQIRVFPNPATDWVKFELPGDAKMEEILLTNVSGDLILRSRVPEIDLNGLPAGFYFYHMTTSAGTASGKLMKLR